MFEASIVMKRYPLMIFFAAGLACGAVHAETTLTNIDQALKVAQAKQEPVFVDFSAVWCHSCHAMDEKVLNGPEWVARQSRFVLVRSDADSSNGDEWMKKLSVPALPTYVVLNPDGSERGRLAGEMDRSNFYQALDRLLSGADAIPKLKADALHGSTDAVAKVLRAYDDRGQQQEGLRWYEGLPAATRKAVISTPGAATRLAVIMAHSERRDVANDASRQRAELMLKEEVDAAKREKIRKRIAAMPPALSANQRDALMSDCRDHARQAMKGQLGLGERFDMAGTLLACVPTEQRKTIASEQLPGLKALYDTEAPSAGSGELREATYALATYYKAATDSAGELALYRRAISIGRKALDDGHGGLDVKRDQAMADVLSEFLNRYGFPSEKPDYVSLQKALVEAYPDNAFYQTEYGRCLLKQGRAAEALPYLERGSDHAAAQDKLAYTRSLAEALIALNRRSEAESLFNAALLKAKRQFPKETAMEMEYWGPLGTAH